MLLLTLPFAAVTIAALSFYFLVPRPQKRTLVLKYVFGRHQDPKPHHFPLPTSTVFPHGPLTRLAPNLHTVTGTLSPRGPSLPRTMTIYRIPKTRKLVLHSVIRLDDSTMNELDRLGTVEIILVPSGMHRMDAAWYGQRYPQARIVCPRGEQEQVEEVVKVHASSEDVFGRLGDDQADKNDVVGRAGEGGIREYVRIMKPTRGFYDDVHELIYLVRLESEDDTLVGSRNEQEDTSNQAGDLPRQPPADQRDQATRLARRTVAPRPHALIVCDLFFNIDPLTAGLGTRILGSAVGFGVTALGKFLVVEDKRALRKWIAQDLMRIAKGEQVRVVTVAHGRVVVGKINVLTALDDAVRTLD